MNAKALVPLVAGLGVGGLALFLGINTLKNAQATPQPVAKVKLWAPTQDIPRGTAIRDEMLTALSFPRELVPTGAFLKKDELVGRVPKLVAPAGLPVLESMLAPAGTRPGIFVKPGYRAVAVKIDSGSAVDFHLEPGAFVDVVASFQVRRNNRQETIARCIVENVELAAVGPRVSPGTNDDADSQRRNQQVRAVTLFVKPDEVPKLLLAEQRGRIKLSLRGEFEETSKRDAEFVSDMELLGETPPADASKPSENPLSRWMQGLFAPQTAPEPPAPPVLAAVPPPPAEPTEPEWVVRVFRGDREEVVRFKSRESRERVPAAKSADRQPTAAAAPPAREKPAPAAWPLPTEPEPTLDPLDDDPESGDPMEPEEPHE
ncbi:MAG: Flp pilus assembly protein CpaB [Phycisphaerales bacterium]|nr:Flp pilus assembly protein CpaB [Phycisphaerales bacterium]